MAAPQSNRSPRETVEFTPNVPQTVALKFPQGKVVAGNFGERVLYTTTDNRVFFVSPEVAGQIEDLGVNVRENFTITRRLDAKGATSWEVARCVGEQPNGTLVVPKPPAIAQTPEPARKPVASALVSEAKALVDEYAEVLAYALDKHQGRVKPDEVRNLLVTAYIQIRKFSSVA